MTELPSRARRSATTRRRARLRLEDTESDSDASQPTLSPQKPAKSNGRTAHDAQLTPHARRKSRRTAVREDADVKCEELEAPGESTSLTETAHSGTNPVDQTPSALRIEPTSCVPGTCDEPSVENVTRATVRPAPLSDITEVVNNAQQEPENRVNSKEISSHTMAAQQHTEKPMDIVIRTRAKPAPIIPDQHEPKPRLVITYLTLTNFKSYAGTQKVGPFHASFSSVVGPNGSGKSNVIDSLLFVFGFRASKMRQGKISSLIHHSAGYPDLDHCEVQVHFEEVIDRPDGQKECVPGSTLIVSRKAFKNNSSSYYINGATSNFTSVTSLLRERGIDLDHKRFLILQGEVESIAQMKPKAGHEHEDGLLEYLEDIIGTSKYKTPIEESAAEFDSLNEACVEKNTRVQHVEKEKQSLEGKKDAALDYIRRENDLAVKQSTLWQVYVQECHDNVEVLLEAINVAEKKLEEDAQLHVSHDLDIKTLEDRCRAMKKELVSMEHAVATASASGSKADKEVVKIEEKKKHLSSKMKKLEKALQGARAGLSDASNTAKQLSEHLETANCKMSDIKQRLQCEEGELDLVRANLRGKTQSLSDAITEKQRLLEPTLRVISEKESAIAVAESQLHMVQDQAEACEKAMKQGAQRVEELAADQQRKRDEIDQIQERIKTQDRKLQQLRKELAQIQHRQPEVRARVISARSKTEEARASFAKLQIQGSVLSSLMRLQESGRITGFHGRLGNLGAIDNQYDVAISTACPSLDNLVVESVEVAQQCIDHLRKNNLGRANFICLDRLNKRSLDKIQTPEEAPRLFDLVRAKDTKFLPAFYNVLQNTLVADSLDQANRIAYGPNRWRVVTLEGQLIDKSGTMSGGGTRVARGAMSSKIVADVSKEQVAKLESTQETEEQSLRNIQSEETALTESVKAAGDEIPILRIQVQKATLELESLQRNSEDAKKRQAELRQSSKASVIDSKEVLRLERSIESHRQHIEKARSNSSGIEEEIRALQEQIMEAGGVQLRSQKAKVDSLREELESVVEQISATELEMAKTEKQMAKHEQTRKTSEEESHATASNMEELDSEVAQRVEEANALRRQIEEATNEVELKKESIAQLQQDLDDKRTEMNEMRGVELTLRNEVEGNQKALAENERRLRYWQDKLCKLTVQSFSELGEDLPEPGLPELTRDELLDVDKEVVKAEIAVLEEATQNATVELGVLTEYRRRVEEHAARSGDLAEAVRARDAAKRRCEELRRLRLEGFMEGFSTISLRLKEMYQMITMGGNAELELVDSLDPFSEGILFSVMPPKKSWKNISNLSGGEKTLSSLALVFALHHYKPTPLYVMDEIDAALDFRNVSIVASYIKTRTQNAQFIVISLRNNMFELAARLVGVYKVNHMTKSVTVENRDYIQRA